jgi:hypothetical protein
MQLVPSPEAISIYFYSSPKSFFEMIGTERSLRNSLSVQNISYSSGIALISEFA